MLSLDSTHVEVVLSSVIRYTELKSLFFNELFPALRSIERSCILAVDQRYADCDDEVHLTPSSEVAVIPPLSGG
ncbi:unnamed protein product [Auanema sp. JU1783]|nr:unnamed protein product [Auanema sp. JU1783]